ncbi:MAG: hypothetical protein ABFS12_15060 [Bacteroidota bacterium]
MKRIFNISHKWRKLTAILLLLNFAVSPLLHAFSQEECNGVCEMDSVIHECSSEATVYMEMNCCNMMDMNSSNNTTTSTTCGMELSDLTCAQVLNEQVNYSYIVPKTLDSKVEFVQLSTIDLQHNSSKVELFELIKEFTFENKPPIYLTISSFLN